MRYVILLSFATALFTVCTFLSTDWLGTKSIWLYIFEEPENLDDAEPSSEKPLILSYVSCTTWPILLDLLHSMSRKMAQDVTDVHATIDSLAELGHLYLPRFDMVAQSFNDRLAV